MAGKAKLVDLQNRAEAEEERTQKLVAEREALMTEARELMTERRSAGAVRVVEIDHRLAQIKVRVDGLRPAVDEQSRTAMRARHACTVAQQRLREARRVLDVISQPPPWGLGEYTRHDIARFEEQAKATIRELT